MDLCPVNNAIDYFAWASWAVTLGAVMFALSWRSAAKSAERLAEEVLDNAALQFQEKFAENPHRSQEHA